MTNSFDRSHKDKKYFIDDSTYNCPFCNRRNVKYTIADTGFYDSSNLKAIYYYIVKCEDCRKKSLHLSRYELGINNWSGEDRFAFPPKKLTTDRTTGSRSYKVTSSILDSNEKLIEDLDKIFFYHDPTAFFTIDDRIPLAIREPLSEADNSLKSNFLTGASGCLRKAIYKLLRHEGIPEMNPQNETFLTHDSRIDLLKEKYPETDPELFDELKAVHMLTSQELHENDWEDFDSATLRHLHEVTKEILSEMYVTPDEKRKRREELSHLKKKAKPKKIIKIAAP